MDESTPGPGQFCCDECGGIFDDGDEDAALAEAEANGFDSSDCGVVCDECYARIMGEKESKPVVGHVTIGGVRLDVTGWEGEGVECQADPILGLLVPTDVVVAGSHKPTTRTPVPTDQN